MDSRPVKTIPIHDHLRGKLCDLYENDCIFDKFECTWSGTDSWVTYLGNHLLVSDTGYVQACAYGLVPQLLPNIRRGVAE